MEIFEKLPEEKRDRILNAGFYCFGQNGYKKTSVADIAGRADVAKSSIFHYFGSKRDLWVYLYHYGIELIMNGLPEMIQDADEDFFNRLWLVQRYKIDIVWQYPDMFGFYMRSLSENDPDVAKRQDAEYKRYSQQGLAMMLEGVDWGKFKPGVDKQKAMRVVTWVLEGYVRDETKGKTKEEMTREAMAYLHLLKGAFYREEYCHEHD